MTTRRGLGKGLGALIPPGDGETSRPPAGVAEVSVADIAPNPRQPRENMEPAALEELAESIRTHGLIQPLVLTMAPAGSAARYYLCLLYTSDAADE